jgi:hypothetical protein
MFTFVRFLKGLVISVETDPTKQMNIQVSNSATTGTSTSLVAAQTANQTVTLPDATDTLVGKATSDILTNKSIDADTNTLSNIENADIKAGAAIDATKIADGSVSNVEFQFINSVTSNVQTQLTNNGAAISDHLADAVDAHDASAISNIPSGNLAATDVQSALNELQSDIDTRATTASNIGTGAGQVFKQKTGSTLELKTIKAGTNITVTNNTNDITIDASGSGSGANQFLSNLTSPTAINQDLIPSGGFNLGTSSFPWSDVQTNNVNSPSDLVIASNGGGIGIQILSDSENIGLYSYNATVAPTLQFFHAADDRFVGIKSPDTISASFTLNLPDADGSNGQVLTTDGAGNLSFSTPSTAGDIGLYVDSLNGHASTFSDVPRFSNSRKNTLGSYATYADSSTNGANVTINASGIGLWQVQFSYFKAGAVPNLGIAVNGTNSSIVGMTYANGKRAITSTGSAGNLGQVSTVLYLTNGDVVQPVTDQTTNAATSDNIIFSMVYLGS